jgi:FAD/FMN-containing dehydrogenase
LDTTHVQSWGRLPALPCEIVELGDRNQALPPLTLGSQLPHGNSRSYGDVCLNDGGRLLDTRHLDRFIAFDPECGVMRCEAGVLLADIQAVALTKGWMLAVTPGTQFVTVGGAIANDVHGKNHHRAGTFGVHLRAFELLRSDGERRTCSRKENQEWFEATLGGMGLTGLITWAELQLRRVQTAYLECENIRFGNLAEFFDIASQSDVSHEYTVAWIDCTARGSALGRGVFKRANHTAQLPDAAPSVARTRPLRLCVTPPFSLVNKASIRAFNAMYYRTCRSGHSSIEHYEPFFYPLDAVRGWNRMYGPRGFYQYQFVVPGEAGENVMAEILTAISASQLGSFLAVLKVFGTQPSVGLMSFPMPGVTLALDFPNQGDAVTKLFARLDQIVGEASGRIYAAKDARTPRAMWLRGYPNWERFKQFVDPTFSSTFYRRMESAGA